MASRSWLLPRAPVGTLHRRWWNALCGPGQSGNPGGLPRGTGSMIDAAESAW